MKWGIHSKNLGMNAVAGARALAAEPAGGISTA